MDLLASAIVFAGVFWGVVIAGVPFINAAPDGTPRGEQ